MKVCTLKYHPGYRNRIVALGNRPIYKEGGTPKAREDQREGTLRISWLFPASDPQSIPTFRWRKRKLNSYVICNLVLEGRSTCGLHAFS